MTSKKGLSNIVATVLIVLLALAAVAIVWGFLRPMFTGVGNEVDLRSLCFDTEVQPLTCTYSNNPAVAGEIDTTANGRLKTGDVYALRFIVNSKSGKTIASGDQMQPIVALNSYRKDYNDGGGWNNYDLVANGILAAVPTSVAEYAGTGGLLEFVFGAIVGDATSNEACNSEKIACTFVPVCAEGIGLCSACEDADVCNNALGSIDGFHCEWNAGTEACDYVADS
ncbi:MAG: hypothetical protein KKD18_02305 [Nanoarchaeota archaeon]|nr:hypothetical protein [Nanoarchaeota archaeon]MBU0977223.1 hypothetical protein [Nanoarchaeota archaeon]